MFHPWKTHVVHEHERVLFGYATSFTKFLDYVFEQYSHDEWWHGVPNMSFNFKLTKYMS